MSDVVVVALIVAIPPTIAALLAWSESKRTTAKADVIVAKADEIHTLTNSNLAAVKADLAMANSRIVSLEALVSKLTDELT
jgi:hypothetical protein